MSYQSDVMREMHKRISSAIAEIRKIGMDAHFIDEVSLEMQLISDIENMMERIADSVYEKIRAADGDCDEQDFPKLTPATEGCQRHGGNQAASGCAEIHREDEGAGVIGCDDECVKPTIEGLLILALSVACVIFAIPLIVR